MQGSRRTRSRRPHSSGGPGPPMLAALFAVVVVVAVVMLVRRGGSPGAVAQVPQAAAPEPYALTADDRAAFVQAARTLSHMDDPREVGPADRVVAFRRLCGVVEAGRLGVTWPTFGADLSAVLAQTFTQQARARAMRDDEVTKDLQPTLEAFDRLAEALDHADLVSAKAAHANWAARIRRFQEFYPPR